MQLNNRKTLITLLVLILAILAIILTVWLLTHGEINQTTPHTTPTLNTDGSDIQDGEIPVGDYQATLAAIQEKVDASRFEVKCNSSISRDPQTGKYNLLIGNTARNRYNCYVEIVSKANNSLIYRSPVLRPGQFIPTANIDGQVPDTVDASANFIILNPDTNAYMGKVVVAVTIQNRSEAGQP